MSEEKPWEKYKKKEVVQEKKPWEQYSNVKKKGASEPTSEEEQSVSPTQTTQQPTSLDTEQPTRAQVAVSLGGPTKLFQQQPVKPNESIMSAQPDVLVPSKPIEQKQKKYYRQVSDERKDVQNTIVELENRHLKAGRNIEELRNEGTYQYLQQKKDQLDKEFKPAEVAIREIQKNNPVWWEKPIERLVSSATEGKSAFFNTERIELNNDVENKLIDTFDSAPEEVKDKWLKGGLALDKKEEIIKNAKNNVLVEKYNSLNRDVKDYLKNIKNNPNISDEDKSKIQGILKDKNDAFKAQVALDYSGSLLKNSFKETEDNKKINEAILGNYEGFIPEQVDVLSSFLEGMGQVTAKSFTGIPEMLLLGSEKFNQIVGISKPEDYSPIESTLDLINDTTNLNFLPSSETEKGKLFKENGEQNFSLYSIEKTLANTLPFTLQIMKDVKNGRIDGNTQSMISQLINPKNSKEFADKLRVAETAYKLTIGDNYREAKDLGMDDSKAFTYANVMSMADGVSENIIPDFKYFDSLTGATIKSAFKNSLKSAATKQAVKNVTKDFFKNIALELGEEEFSLAVEDGLKYSLLLNHKNSEFFNLKRQKELVASTVIMSGAIGGVNVTGKFKENKTDIYREVYKNIDGLQQSFNDEINSPLNDEKTKDTYRVAYKFATDVSNAVAKSPENVTSDQIDLLVQKDKLEEKKKTMDTAFHPDINEEIAAIDTKIRELAKMPAVEEVAAPEVVVEEVTKPEVEVKPTTSGQKVSDVLNRPATLESFGGTELEAPVEGNIYQDGQRVIFEDNNNKTYDLGNIDEISDTTVEELGIKPQTELMSVTPEGKIKVGENTWNIQTDLPNNGVEYDADGNVKAVSLKDDSGKTVMYEGQIAEDIAYQTLLNEVQTDEQRQAINEILENDEELNRQLNEAEEATAETTSEVVEPGVAEVTATEEIEPSGIETTLDEVITPASNDIKEQISRAKRAISKLLPNVEIIYHTTAESYKAVVGDNSRGYYEGNKIHINGSNANARTVSHEVFHAVVLKNISSNKQATDLTNRMLKALSKSLKSKPQVMADINRFVEEGYSKDLWSEEKLAEVLGYLASEYDTLPDPSKNIIKKWLDKLAVMLKIKPFTDQQVVDLMNALATKVAYGQEVTEADVSILSEKEINIPGSQIIGSTNIKFKRQAKVNDFDTTPPKVEGINMIYPSKSDIKDVLEKSGGAAVFINSDGTKVGKVSINGRDIIVQGGIDYTFIKENVDDNIGFAASEDSKISYLKSISEELIKERDAKNPKHKGKPIAVFVVAQNGETMLGEWYAAEYIMEGIDQSISENETVLDDIKKDFINAIESAKLSGNKSGLADRKAKDKVLKMIKEGKFDTHKGRIEIAKEMASKDFSFGFRVNLNKELIAGNEKSWNSGKNRGIKKALSDVGHTMNDFWNKFLDERFLNKLNNTKLQANKGSSISNKTFSGFFYNPSDSLEDQVNHAKLGIDHAQFNSSFKSQENFLLDSAYDVNKLFPNMGYPTQSGIDLYNSKNKTDFNKKNMSIIDKTKVSTWLNNNNSSKLVVNPYSSISLSIYTGTVNEKPNIEKEDKTIIRKQISAENSSNYANMTEDNKGNFVFYHYGPRDIKAVDPKRYGSNKGAITSKPEVAAMGRVGGMAQFYTNPEFTEHNVTGDKYMIKVPMDKVYDFNTDPENFYDKAKEMFKSKHPDLPFTANDQLAYITKLAEKAGYDMTVAEWNNMSRAQATKALKPMDVQKMDGDVVSKPFNEDYESNSTKGFESVVPVSKSDKLEQVYKDINSERNSKNKYDSLYSLAEDFPKLSQDEITDMIENSDISQEMKDAYAEALAYEPGKRMSGRRQKTVSPIDTAVEAAKKQGFDDKQIIEYLMTKGYTRAQATNAVIRYDNVKAVKLRKADQVFTKEGRNKLVTFFDSLRRRSLSAKSFLPKSLFLFKEKIEANIEAEAKRATYLVKEFNKMVDNYKGDVESLLTEFDKYLRGDQTAIIPDEFKAVAGKMRMHIDNLSNMLIETGAVTPTQAETIRKNMGEYINRSYQVFDKKNWKKQVTEEMKNAARLDIANRLRPIAEKEAEKTGKDVDILLNKLIDEQINELLEGKSAASFLGVGKTGSKDTSIMKEKTDIPPSIRALMGEYTDPTQNYSRTIFKLASYAENARFLQSAKEAGMGVFFFPSRNGEFDTKIAGDASKTMNPLNGLYTTKEIADALSTPPGLDALLETKFGTPVKTAYETYMKFVSTVKWLKTIASIGTHAKNIFGNVWFMLSNGYINPKQYANSFAVIKNSSREDLRDKLDEYIRAGIVNQSATLGEIRAMFNDANFEDTLDKRLKTKPIAGFINKLKKLSGKLSVAYQAEDDFFKIISYETEKARYSKAFYSESFDKLNDDQKTVVKDYAAEITKNVLPNYGRVPNLVKFLRVVPVTGTFISFQAEAYRTAWNSVALSIDEMKSDNKKVKAIGAKRLIGIAAAQGLKFGLMTLLGKAISGGDDDDDELSKYTKMFVAPWSTDSDIVLVSHGDGKMSYIDFSASDPHGGIKKAYNAAMSGDDFGQAFGKGMGVVLEPFLKEDIFKELIGDITENKNSYGNTLYNEKDSNVNKVNAIMARIYKTFEPGSFSTVRKIYESEDKGNEILGQMSGYKVNTVDINKQLGFKMQKLKAEENEARKIYNSAFRKYEAGEITEDEYNAAYNQANDATKEVYSRMYDNIKASSFFGVSDEGLTKTMDDARLSDSLINSLFYGEYPDIKEKASE